MYLYSLSLLNPHTEGRNVKKTHTSPFKKNYQITSYFVRHFKVKSWIKMLLGKNWQLNWIEIFKHIVCGWFFSWTIAAKWYFYELNSTTELDCIPIGQQLMTIQYCRGTVGRDDTRVPWFVSHQRKRFSFNVIFSIALKRQQGKDARNISE